MGAPKMAMRQATTLTAEVVREEVGAAAGRTARHGLPRKRASKCIGSYTP